MTGKPASDDTGVLIAGAGPVGLALAIELARRDIPLRIVDRSAGPAAESRALGTQARTIEHLRMMGIGEDRLVPSLRAREMVVHDGARVIARVRLRVERPDATYHGLLVMSQADTERMLLARLGDLGIAVGRGVSLTGFSQDDHGVIGTLSGPDGARTVRAQFLAGCDGARSAVRHHLREDFAGFTYPQRFLLGDCRIAGDRPRDQGNAWLHPDGLLFALPLPGDGLWRVIIADRTAGDDAAPPAFDELAGVARERSRGTLTPSDPVWLSRFTVNCRMAGAYRFGRVFLAGDAAHVHSPVGGQGMNTGIQDAVNLGWKLALAVRGRASDPLLDTYAAERMPVARAVLRGSDRGFRAMMPANPALRWLRDRAIGLAASAPAFGAAVSERISELGIDYRNSPLTGPPARAGFGARAPRPGDRAPQASFEPAIAGEPATLFDVYGLGGFTLLLFPDPANPSASLQQAATIGGWVRDRLGDDCRPLLVVPGPPRGVPGAIPAAFDTAGEIRRVVGATGEAAVLVRPDGYLAARAASLDQAAIWRALAAAFAPGLLPGLPDGGPRA
ncbi:MAG: FAD-dependent monooxygenase [Chloroflexota bacterium]